MTTSLKALKAIDQTTQCTVFGYIRQQEKQLSLYINITPEIIYLCLAYYYLGEYFDKVANCYTLSQDKRTVTKVNDGLGWDNTAYGIIWIDSAIPQIVQWKFKINKLLFENGIYFCLVSTDNRINEDCLNTKIVMDYPNYGFSDNFFFTCNNMESKVNNENALDEKFFKGNDTVIMILNTKDRELHCQNEKDEKLLIFDKVKIDKGIRYKMAVQLYDEMNSVSLIDFDLRQFND